MSYNENKLVKLKALKELAVKTNAEHQVLANRTTALEAETLVGVQVNGTALAIAERMVEILIAQGTKNGSISVNGVDIGVKGLQALAYKANISEADLNQALKDVINAKAEKSALTALANLVGVIPEGYKATTITGMVTEEVAKIVGGASEAFDTLKEFEDWIKNNQDGAAGMTSAITENKKQIDAVSTLIGSLPEGATSTTVIEYIAEEIKKIGISNYVTQIKLTETLEGFVQKENGKGLSQENFTTAQKTKLDGMEFATDGEVQAMIAEVFATV